MPAETLTKNERMMSQPISAVTEPDDELRAFARKHIEHVRRLRLHIAAFVLGMVVLTPVWALAEWQTAGGFERLSDNGSPGDWEPWILYVGLAWGLVVAIVAMKVYFERPTTRAEVDREVERLRLRS